MSFPDDKKIARIGYDSQEDIEEADYVLMSKSTYDLLIKSHAFLNCLYTYGVDSWIGFVGAQRMFNDKE